VESAALNGLIRQLDITVRIQRGVLKTQALTVVPLTLFHAIAQSINQTNIINLMIIIKIDHGNKKGYSHHKDEEL
jgi:hypothetical protein